METSFNAQEKSIESAEWYTLDEKEMAEINGGGCHWKLVDGKFVMVED